MARNANKSAWLAVTFGRAASFAEAVDVDLATFAAEESVYADWPEGENPSVTGAADYFFHDEALEAAVHWREYAGVEPITGTPTKMLLHFSVLGPKFIGSAVTAIEGVEPLGPEDLIDYHLMQYAQRLTNWPLN